MLRRLRATGDLLNLDQGTATPVVVEEFGIHKRLEASFIARRATESDSISTIDEIPWHAECASEENSLSGRKSRFNTVDVEMLELQEDVDACCGCTASDKLRELLLLHCASKKNATMCDAKDSRRWDDFTHENHTC